MDPKSSNKCVSTCPCSIRVPKQTTMSRFPEVQMGQTKVRSSVGSHSPAVFFVTQASGRYLHQSSSLAEMGPIRTAWSSGKGQPLKSEDSGSGNRSYAEALAGFQVDCTGISEGLSSSVLGTCYRILHQGHTETRRCSLLQGPTGCSPSRLGNAAHCGRAISASESPRKQFQRFVTTWQEPLLTVFVSL